MLKTILAVVSALVLVVTGFAWSQYRNLADGLRRSGAIDGSATSTGGAVNILIMGLDSRLDENGNPLPAAIYDAMHTGGADVGGYNANVLMLLHIPAGDGKATAISIPRDDYVSLAGSPDDTSKGKIKQAYGLAFDQEHTALVKQGVTDKLTLEQRSRDAGRKTEIDTVSQFLGNVPIDHFVEVTMIAFYQIAQVVQPITVCVNENTRDSYSGADFHEGHQQIDAVQAVAFVRQRRDNTHPNLNFTDLDRERRQQAFIASLAYQLKQAGTITNPTRLGALLDVAKQNTAIDNNLDLLGLAQQASGLAGGNVTFTTLPIDHFGTDPIGEDVNFVNTTLIRALVHTLLADTPTPAPDPAGPLPTVDVINTTGRTGLAATVAHSLLAAGYTAGTTGNAPTEPVTTIHYPPSDAAAAATLATILDTAQTQPDPTIEPAHLRVVLGSGFTLPTVIPTVTAPANRAVPGAGTAPTTPTLTDSISGGSVPCVK